MKILFTGGGSGGHFYPIIAVIDAVDDVAAERRLVDVVKHYMASSPYDEKKLFDRQVYFHQVPAGKMRAYFSPLNVIDAIKTGIGILKALIEVYTIYPDVVFSKGGKDSIPSTLAARFFRIPVVVHESDAVPGSANRWAGKFARRVAVGFPDAGQYFAHEKVAHTGTPVRKEITEPQHEGSRSFFQFEEDLPVLLILGGSQGAQAINEHVLDALPELVKRYYIIHQTGVRNFEQTSHVGKIVLEGSDFAHRYRPFAYLNDLQMKMAAGAAELAVCRSGATTIAELALWGLPSIMVPLPTAKHDHQKENAFAYARAGAAIVIEEVNLTPGVLVAEADRLVENTGLRKEMRDSAKSFAKPDAARVIAEELINIALEHEA